ncbi:MAG: hypothetical protein EOM91_12550 [Sphingobacteriia bacterium]|nr:hypothetical protein [Sphingobacteriia bacterium]
MDDRETTHLIHDRIARLEARMKAVEHTLEITAVDVGAIRDDLKRELSRQSEELALTRQAVRIFEDTVKSFDGRIREMSSESKEMLAMLHEHIVAAAGEKTKVLVGVFTAGATGLASLGVLIWGVMQVASQIAT